ncbi:MAG: 6-carboxytetrahydropterin synthase [Candidatus Caenarcaniphilales bacterium]|nr:6-carboxytetrahydropterin synthase [Candidatus Caenarcaniphilales bacterium]
MSYKSTIELFKEDMKFSAGHFTVFSASERERLHGHNFKVQTNLTFEVPEDGLPGDYNIFKNKIRQLCKNLDEYFLLPEKSPHLRFQEINEKQIKVHHSNDELVFYKKDIKLLPISNTTVEELSFYLTSEIIADKQLLNEYKISFIEVKVSSGDGQFGCYKWEI